MNMLSLNVADIVPCPRCAIHAASCRVAALPSFASRSGTVSGLRFAKSRRCSSISQQKRRLQCYAKKSRKNGEPVQEQQQYQAEAAVPPPQASTRRAGMVRLGALGSGAVALIVACAVVFAIKKFAKQKLPEEEKVRLPLSAVHFSPLQSTVKLALL